MSSFALRSLPILAAFVFRASHLMAAELFPFVLPWDDASPGPTNLSGWLEKPAGVGGFVSVKDGHLFANGKRLRIFGVNMAFGANFPTHADAEKVAARMAKFGINCVRFHHMEMQAAPGGIWQKDMVNFDPEQLDRLDYFIAQLKAQGIYTDLNLHVSRSYPGAPSREEGVPEFGKGVDNFDAKMIAQQKDYARALLTHVNPYTKTAYVAEPAVALIEINNENALLDEWQRGALDKLPTIYRDELAQLFTASLRAKYGSDEKLTAAWAEGAKSAGEEMLKNGRFASGLDGWNLEQHEGALASASAVAGTLRVEVKKITSERWHVQIGQGGLRLKAGESYALTFRARADAPREITASTSQAHAPWGQIASRGVSVGPEWKSEKFLFTAKEDDENARVVFTSLGGAIGVVEFADVAFRPAGLDGSVPRDDAQRVRAFTRDDLAGRTPAAQRDWYAFLWALEEKYWTGMYAFIRKDLGAKSLIVGTQLGWSPFPIQSQMDVIDSHAYWQHPNFPGRSWDSENWNVKNVPMAGVPGGGTLAELALQRVAGKPYICTEYAHSAPNEFAGEGFPLICAYAALQDWDGIFAFAYSHRANDWNKGYFPSFFDIDQHPVKMATLPGALATFLRGDVSTSKSISLTTPPLETVFEKSREVGPRIGAGNFGLSWMDALKRRVAIQLGASLTKTNRIVSGGPSFSSETSELKWDPEQRTVTVDARKSKALIGSLSGIQNHPIGDLGISWNNPDPLSAVLQFTVVEGDDFKSAKRILITATGRAENTDMKWKSDAHDSVGSQWGRAPSLVEGIAAKITLPVSKPMKAWALDERGQRGAEVPVVNGALEIGPQYRTLWYEVAAE